MTPNENRESSEKSLPASLPSFKRYSGEEFRELARKTLEVLAEMKAAGEEDKGYPRNYASQETPIPPGAHSPEKSQPAPLPSFKGLSRERFLDLLDDTVNDLKAMEAEAKEDKGYPRNYAGSQTPTPDKGNPPERPVPDR